jgi:hypothetical protein
VLRVPDEPRPGASERREHDRTYAQYHQRRQRILDLDRERRMRRMFLVSDEYDPSMIASFHAASSWLWNVVVRWRGVGVQPDFYRTTDLEAAAVETAERQQLEQQLRENEIDLARLTPEKAIESLMKAERESEAACKERNRLEHEQPALLAAADERESREALDFETAFAVASLMKPSHDIVSKRRDEAISRAERPKAKRPSRTHAEEAAGGH